MVKAAVETDMEKLNLLQMFTSSQVIVLVLLTKTHVKGWNKIDII